MRITAAIIVRDEEHNLAELLPRLEGVDEIVVVDGGSADRTLGVASACGCRVESRPFDNFANQRNHACRLATGDWILSIDADERPTPRLLGEIRRVTAASDRVAYRVPIRSTIFGRPVRYGGTQDDRPLRLFRRGRACWRGNVHEVLEVDGPTGLLEGWLEHSTLPDLDAFLAKVHRYTTLEAHARVRAGSLPRPCGALLAPAREVFRRLVWKWGLLDGPAGWAFCLLSGLSEWLLATRHRHCWNLTRCRFELPPPGEGRGEGVSPTISSHLTNAAGDNQWSGVARSMAGFPHPCPLPEGEGGSTALPLLPLVLDDVPRGLRQALAQEGVPCCNRRQGPAEGRFVLFDSRTGRRCPRGPGQVAIDVARLRGPGARDPCEALLDEQAAVHQWQIGELSITEEIAAVDKRAARRELLDALRLRIEEQGGVWIRLAAFPFPYRSAFNFRLDYDHYHPDDFSSTLEAIAGSESATSHYVNGSAFASSVGALARLRGLDVGSHGFWHHTYRTVEENLRNLGRGIELLRSAGIEPSGFVAPHGRFNRTLLTALETLGVTHSSEFGLAYDELPFAVGSGAVLQIPIHPVCLELFLEAVSVGRIGNPSSNAADLRDGLAIRPTGKPTPIPTPLLTVDDAVRAAIDYYRELIDLRCRAGEPVFLYGHPTGRRGCQTDVLPAILQCASSAALWRTTLGRFHAWWRARASVRLSVAQQGERLVVAAARSAPGWRLGIECLRGSRVALMPLEGETVSFAPGALAYESRETSRGILPTRVQGAEDLRGRVRRWIDWELATPVDQIGAGNWQNWTKRTLRWFWKPCAAPSPSGRGLR